ncbi:spore photoproduct lyase family protein [Terriglobus sp.]|uniref:spore photoproduct lyase family protein n=1 Tax=Terriglobus sp. TaxID=1889013 RepID=UPI003B001883
MGSVSLPVLQNTSCNTEPVTTETTAPDAALAEGRLWRPRRVYITPDAYALPHGRAMLERAEGFGAEVIRLKQNRLTGLSGQPGEKDERKAYALAKTSLAIVVSPPSARRLQPIPPSADWQFHLAQGCPAHCQYCYLAGSLSGPPITRAYANLHEILENLREYVGTGKVTSASAERAHEGTTFEASCYTDPLGIEHLTGGLEESVRFFGAWDAPVQLRFTTKFAAVGPLLGLQHHGRTRVRFSLNAASVARDFEGGTATMAQRIRALRRMAMAGYPVGLTVAPIMPVEGWQAEYTALFTEIATALDGVAGLDLTAELITHRFTAGSREVLLGWYPKTTLDLAKENRSEKRNKFGGFKYVYPKDRMAQMREWFYAEIARVLPGARVLYWT